MCALRWDVVYKGVHNVLDPLGLTDAAGVGYYVLKPWLGSMGVVTGYLNWRLGLKYEVPSLEESLQDMKDQVVSSGIMRNGVRWCNKSLVVSRIDSAIDAQKRLEAAGAPDLRDLKYQEYGVRTAKRAAGSRKLVETAWDAAKTNIVQVTAKRPPYDIDLEDPVPPLMDKDAVPIAKLDDEYAELLGFIGVKPTVGFSEGGIVAMIRKYDRGFVGDMSDAELTRYLLRINQDMIPDALVGMGMDRQAAESIPMHEMLDAMVPPEFEAGVSPVVYPYADISNENLERLITVDPSAPPLLRRWALQVGLAFFCAQPKPYRKVIVNFKYDGDTGG